MFSSYAVFNSYAVVEPFSKKCGNWCHKAYTDKNEKQVRSYVALDGVETFSDTWDH